MKTALTFILSLAASLAFAQSGAVETATLKVGTSIIYPGGGTTLGISSGGTGQTSASAAFNALAPSKTGNGNKYLRVNAGETDYELVTLAGGGDALKADPLSQFAATTSLQFIGVISDETGTGLTVFNNSPTFLDDITVGTAGTATGDILIKGTTSGTVTLTANDAAGTPTITFGTVTGTVAITADKLSAFANTTSAELAGVITNETGTGVLVYSADPALTGAPTAPTASLNTNSTQIATTAYVDTKVHTLALTSNATANSTTSMVEITGMNITVGTGTYVFEYYIRAQSGATTNSLKFAVNHTGTVTTFQYNMYFPSAGVTAATGAIDQEINATTGQVWAYQATRAKNTTLGPETGVDTINSDILFRISGLMIVTVSGDLELYHGSEEANSSQVMAGTCLVLTKVAD